MRDLLHAEITAQAMLRPDAPAVVSAGERLTYGELEEASNRLARLLRAEGCSRGDRVCVLMPKGPTVLIAILGVLKADAIWVPIDPSSSAPAVRRILTACESKWILAADTHGAVLDELFADAEFASTHLVGWLSRTRIAGCGFHPTFTWTDLDVYSSAPMRWVSGPDDAAHFLFPFGSTTGPTVVTHGNVLGFVRWARRYFSMSSDDRVSWHSPLHSKLATFDMFGALGIGAALYPVPSDLGVLPYRLAEFIRHAELTQWFSAPGVLSHIASFDAMCYGDFPGVRRVLWCGKPLPTSTLMYWMQRMPHSTFTALYAPAEAAIASSYFTVTECPDDEDVEIPIGRACPGVELLVLDAMLCPLPVGETGDLYIRGAGLSPRCWGNEETPRGIVLPGSLNGSRGDRIYPTGTLARVGLDGFVYYARHASIPTPSGRSPVEVGDFERLRAT